MEFIINPERRISLTTGDMSLKHQVQYILHQKHVGREIKGEILCRDLVVVSLMTEFQSLDLENRKRAFEISRERAREREETRENNTSHFLGTIEYFRGKYKDKRAPRSLKIGT